jgi:hypothetical protein
MKKVAIAALAVLALGIVALPALASHPEASLPGSNFEIDEDANLVLDDPAPSVDWGSLAHPNGPELRATDLATGQNDDSYKGGVKEDTSCPGETTGSIPNNKSDLLTFHVYEEEGDPGFLNLAWSRVSDPSGTTLMDFEFNQAGLDQACPTGPNVQRTAGDLLIEYAIDQGGARAEISGRFWTGTAWGGSLDLDDGTDCDGGPCAVGTINQTQILAADSDGLGLKQPRTFGEAQIDLDLIFEEGECTSFGTAMLKSRSSDSFTSQLKDFIRPIGIDVSNCGSIKVTKTDTAEDPTLLDGAVFNLVADEAPIGGLTGPGVEDDTVVDTCTTGAEPDPADDDGVCSFDSVLQGEYWVVEVTAPAGYDLADPPYQHVTVVADETVEVTFENAPQEGAVLITKTAKHAASETGSIPLPDVTFTIEGGDLPDGGTDVVTLEDGTVCLGGLAFGDYTATETEPDDYNAVGDGVQEFTIDSAASCDDEEFVGESLTFDNVPLTDVTVSVDSLIPGGTASTISCDTDPATEGTTDAVTGDGSVTVNDLEPTAPDVTLTCTITIDP